MVTDALEAFFVLSLKHLALNFLLCTAKKKNATEQEEIASILKSTYFF